MNRRLLVIAPVVALLLAASAPAFAHVTVNASDSTRGAEVTTLTFRVPNEQDNASTVQIDIVLPTGVKFELVAAQPIAGWTTSADPSKVTWSGGKIGPGQFQEFKIELGPLPEGSAPLVFKALQTYDNRDVVRWIDPTPANGPEPDHPAPVLTLTAADTASSPAKTASKNDVDQARTLAITGIAVGLIAGIVGLSARRARSQGS